MAEAAREKEAWWREDRNGRSYYEGWQQTLELLSCFG